MPYSDEDRRAFGDIDGYPTDYYPSRRIRVVIGSILAGWFFLVFTSSHQLFVDRLYKTTSLHVQFIMTRDSPLGDWPTSAALYRADGYVTA